jgi:hypothetical protein
VARVDRVATRRVRRSLRWLHAGPRILALYGLEAMGAASVRVGRRGIILIPASWRFPRRELAAIVAHEASHLRRRHSLRRWGIEAILAVPTPSFLLGQCLDAARAEEEWEADDDAARDIGDRRTVARAILRAAEHVVREARPADPALERVAEGDLPARIGRLLQGGGVVPPDRCIFATTGQPFVAIATLAFLLTSHPTAGIWAFCQVEQLLGLACA